MANPLVAIQKSIVSLTPGLGPDVRASDFTQLIERVDESDGHSPLRGRTGNAELIYARKVMHATKDCAVNNLAKTSYEPSIKAGNRYHLQRMYRAATFAVEDATTNPTSPMHNEVII